MNRGEFLKTSLAALVVASIPSHVLLDEDKPKAVCMLYDDRGHFVTQAPIEFFYDEANQRVTPHDVCFESFTHNYPIQTIRVRVDGFQDVVHHIRPVMANGFDFVIVQSTDLYA